MANEKEIIKTLKAAGIDPDDPMGFRGKKQQSDPRYAQMVQESMDAVFSGPPGTPTEIPQHQPIDSRPQEFAPFDVPRQTFDFGPGPGTGSASNGGSGGGEDTQEILKELLDQVKMQTGLLQQIAQALGDGAIA